MVAWVSIQNGLRNRCARGRLDCCSSVDAPETITTTSARGITPMVIAHRLLLGLVLSVAGGFMHSQTPNNASAQPQRLFSIPYGREAGKAFLAVYPGAVDEPYYARGHRELLVAPDGKRIAIIGSRESDTHDEAYEILLFTSEGKFIRRLAYNYTRGYDPKYRLKSTDGFYIVSALYGLDGLLYIRTEQVNLDGTGRTQRIDVYDTEGVYLKAVSEAYTRGLQGYQKLYSSIMVGADKNGRILFDDITEIVTVDRQGTRGWIPKPFSGKLFMDTATGAMYLKKTSSSRQKPRVYELWSESGRRFQKQMSVPSKDGVRVLAQKYTDYDLLSIQRPFTYWRASFSKPRLERLNTPAGMLELSVYDILVFDDAGRLVHTIRYTVPSIMPICRYGGALDAFAVDSLGNMYVLRWTETAIEVWRYAVGSRENKQ
jgi:hypothetical protein